MQSKTKYIKMAVIAIALLTIFLSFIPIQASAKDWYCAKCKQNHSLDGLKLIDFEFTNIVYSGQLFSETDGDATGLNINSLLAFDISQKDTFGKIWDNAKIFYDIMLPIGELMAFIYYLLALMEKVLQDNFSAEQLSKDSIKLVAMILILRNGFELITWGMQLSAFMYQKLQSLTGFNDTGGVCYYNACNNRVWYQSIGNMLSMLLPWLLISMARVIVRVIAWSRILNLVIRVIFAPIGMADSVRGGTSSQGFRYFKKIVSLAIQGTIILGVSVAYNLIVGTITSDGSVSWIQPVVLAAVVVTLIFKSSQMADEVMGC